MAEDKASIGDKFTNLLKVGKSLPGKILLNLKEDGSSDSPQRGGSATHGDNQGGSPTYMQLQGMGSVAQDSSVGGERSGSAGFASCLVKEMTTQVKEVFKLGNRRGDSTDEGSERGERGGDRAQSVLDSILYNSGRPRWVAAGPTPVSVPQHRLDKFNKLLEARVVDIEALRELSWMGIPHALRPVCWRILLGYCPPARRRQCSTLTRKRQEYMEMVPQYYDIPTQERSEDEVAALRQVIVDAPRTAPNVPFFHEAPIQKSLERLLYIWGIRHPASGYVQGMNDLVTPFLGVFLSEHLPGPPEKWSEEQLTEEIMLQVEADCYWCLCKLVEGIQDHYIYAQPGIQVAVFQIENMVRDIDGALMSHLEEQGLQFIQFAWRWVNCLLVREVPYQLSFRLWDTYLSEGYRLNEYLVQVCAAFLLHWKEQLLTMEFQDMIMFLQRLPTQDWDESTLAGVLSNALVYKHQISHPEERKQPQVKENNNRG